ncbi:MAG: Gfo/Idh/MocA family protein [Candidatus Hydrogenedentota bacterium]
MYNIALIGLGRIADLHFRAYQTHPKARVTAICDCDAELLDARRRDWEIEKAYTNYYSILDDPGVDAVEILAPQTVHASIAMDCARAGKAMAIQKPMATSLVDADGMIRAAEEAGIVYKVTDNYLFYPPIAAAKRLIDAGAIGTPQMLRMKFVGGTWHGGWEVPEKTWAWRREEARQGRGMQTFDHGHHLWAVAWHLLGPVERVHAWVDSVDGLVDCPAVISWKYEAPQRYGVCDYTQALAMPIPTDYYACDEWFEVQGDEGLVLVRRCTGKLLDGPPVLLYNGAGWQSVEVLSDWAAGFAGAARNFTAALCGEEAPLLTGAQARDILRFAFALRRSSDERREVALSEMRP